MQVRMLYWLFQALPIAFLILLLAASILRARSTSRKIHLIQAISLGLLILFAITLWILPPQIHHEGTRDGVQYVQIKAWWTTMTKACWFVGLFVFAGLHLLAAVKDTKRQDQEC